VLARCLQRFELVKKKEGRGFRMTFANLSPEVLRQVEYFLTDETGAFKKHPEIYERIPYSAKVAVKTPVRKRPPTLDKEGNAVPKGMPKPRGQNTIADMMTRLRAFTLWAIDNGHTSNNPFKHYSSTAHLSTSVTRSATSCSKRTCRTTGRWNCTATYSYSNV
jgi:hypothetical protein